MQLQIFSYNPNPDTQGNGDWFFIISKDQTFPVFIHHNTKRPGILDFLGIKRHGIDQSGTVTPSVACTVCDFHTFVKFDAWPPFLYQRQG